MISGFCGLFAQWGLGPTIAVPPGVKVISPSRWVWPVRQVAGSGCDGLVLRGLTELPVILHP